MDSSYRNITAIPSGSQQDKGVISQDLLDLVQNLLELIIL